MVAQGNQFIDLGGMRVNNRKPSRPDIHQTLSLNMAKDAKIRLLEAKLHFVKHICVIQLAGLLIAMVAGLMLVLERI